jgi:hypothetical protein
MRDELIDAENNGLSVFIMGHIPPGSFNCDPRILFVKNMKINFQK